MTERASGSRLNSWQRYLQGQGIRPDEVRLTLWMALYFFLAMFSVSMIKSLQNALYLSEVGFGLLLPFLYLILAVSAGLTVILLRHVAGRHSRTFVNILTLICLIVSAWAFLFLLAEERSWVYPLFYIWGGIFSLLVPTQGWLLSNQLFTVRQAKRLFSILGTGGILGGAAGGGYTALTVDAVGYRGLLIQATVVMVLMQLVLFAIHRTRESEKLNAENHGDPFESRQEQRPSRSGLSVLRHSSYLRWIAGLVLTSAAASTMIDLQYKWALEQQYPGSANDMAEFFGSLLGATFIFSAIVQLLFTRRILQGSGVVLGLLVLPLCLLAGTSGVLLLTVFWAVVFLKALDGCLRSSIDKASTELLYLPISGPDTTAAKGIIDLMFYRFGDALGAAIVLGIVGFLPRPVMSFGIILLTVTLALVALAWRVGAGYLRILRKTLQVKPGPVSGDRIRVLEGLGEDTLLKALQSKNAGKIRFALHQLLERSALVEPKENVTQLKIDTQGIRLINAVAPLVDHQDQEIAAAALHLMIRYQPESYLTRLEENCRSDRIPDSLHLSYLIEYVENPSSMLIEKSVIQWVRQADGRQARLLIRLLTKSGDPRYLKIIRDWTRSPDRDLARVAIECLGRFRDMNQVEDLLESLKRRWSRRAARGALVAYGDALTERLTELLRDPEVETVIKREIPPILMLINSKTARVGLVTSLYLPDQTVSYRALRGLNEIRLKQELAYGEATFSPVLQIWTREYYELVNLDDLLGNPKGKPGRLLKKAVRERIEWTIEKLFRGLELYLPAGDAYFSYLGFVSNDVALRENAIELIDLRVRGELRYTMRPIFTAHSTAEVVEAGRKLFNLPTDLEVAYSDLLFSPDIWLRCCIMAVVKSEGRLGLKARVAQASEDIDPVVRETAEWALETWSQEVFPSNIGARGVSG